LHEVAAALPDSYPTVITLLGGPGVLWNDDDEAQMLWEEFIDSNC
jgi:hypothetical protein